MRSREREKARTRLGDKTKTEDGDRPGEPWIDSDLRPPAI